LEFNQLIAPFVFIVIVSVNAGFAMVLPRVFGVLCIFLSLFALAESASKTVGILGCVGFLILGAYNYFLLAKKDKRYIFLANSACWIVFTGLLGLVNPVTN